MGRLQPALFFCGGVNADPKWFGQNQEIASAGATILLEVCALHCAGDGEAENRLGGVDTVTASEWEPQLRSYIPASLHNPIRDFRCQFIDRPSQNGDRDLRGASHRINVRYGVCGRDAAKVIGVVHDGHEKIGRGEHCSIFVKNNRSGVVSRLMPYQ